MYGHEFISDKKSLLVQGLLTNASLNSFKGTQKLLLNTFIPFFFAILHINQVSNCLIYQSISEFSYTCVGALMKRAFYALHPQTLSFTLKSVHCSFVMHFCFLCALTKRIYMCMWLLWLFYANAFYRVVQFNDEMQWRESFLKLRIRNFLSNLY